MHRKTKNLNRTRRKCRTGYIRFDTAHDANRSLEHHHEPEKAEHPVRVWECDDCHGWHLTRQASKVAILQLPYACCGGTMGQPHELSCELVTPEEYFARTGGRPSQEATP